MAPNLQDECGRLTNIERRVPVKHDTKLHKTCVLYSFSDLYGTNPNNPWAKQGYPV